MCSTFHNSSHETGALWTIHAIMETKTKPSGVTPFMNPWMWTLPASGQQGTGHNWRINSVIRGFFSILKTLMALKVGQFNSHGYHNLDNILLTAYWLSVPILHSTSIILTINSIRKTKIWLVLSSYQPSMFNWTRDF